MGVPDEEATEEIFVEQQLSEEIIATYPTPKADYEVRSTVLVDGGDRFGVSSVVFDKFEELIWMGNTGGHVTSYYGPLMQKYTSFQVHMTDEIRDIITTDAGIYVLSKNQLRHQIRRGIPKHTYKSENMVDMQCLYQLNDTKLLIGGHQSSLLELDISKMKETVIPIEEDGCAVMRSGGGSLVACGSVGGVVTLRDLRTPKKVEHAFRAHSACLSDLDMQGDLLITCGFAHSSSGVSAEPYVIVWDVRSLRGEQNGLPWTANLPSAPLLLHFLPAVSGKTIAVSGDGLVSVLDLNSASTCESNSMFQVDISGSTCSVMDVSSTSQALVFGDKSGHLSMFSPTQNTQPLYNNFSRETEFPDPINVPSASLNDTTFKYSSIPLPPLTTGERWFNEFPPSYYRRVYRKPKPIPPEVLKSMKMQGPIGYAPNPKTCRRHEMPYVEDTLEDLTAEFLEKTNLHPIPKYYLKAQSLVRYTKTEGENNEGALENKSGLPSIEPTIPNSYCNCILQVFYHTPVLRAMMLSHTCGKQFCLSCELGFLFRLLDGSGGKPCQATNFLRAFRTKAEAAALGLILPDRSIAPPGTDFISLIQSWLRFILHQIHFEISETRKKEKELLQAQTASIPKVPVLGSRLGNPPLHPTKLVPRLVNGYINNYVVPDFDFYAINGFNGDIESTWRFWQQAALNGHEEAAAANDPMKSKQNILDISHIFAIGREHVNKCTKCSKEEERSSAVLACALQYPTPNKENPSEKQIFVELLKASLATRRSTPAWCENCKRFNPTIQRGRVVRLPPVLAVNCGGGTPYEKDYWIKDVKTETIVTEVPSTTKKSSSKLCRYGVACSRPGCKFKHPDRPDSSPSHSVNNVQKNTSRESLLPLRMTVNLLVDGDIVINDTSEAENGVDISTTVAQAEYSLSSAVVCIEDNPKNLVSYIRIAGEHGITWYLFNDLTVVPVEVEEVVQLNVRWKTPCIVFYVTSHSIELSRPHHEQAP